MRTMFLVLLLIGATVGCSGGVSTGGSAATTSTAAPRPVRGPANLISAAEIEAAGSELRTALDLVQRLRPAMLRTRDASASVDVLAYMDGVRLGSWQALAQVQRGLIREIRYYSPSEATQKWGTGHLSGAVEVFMRR
ncbi:MAG: hypothetical protein ACKN99_02535 [Gemmatimonadota bacterium]